MLRMIETAPAGFALVIHGGAFGPASGEQLDHDEEYRQALRQAHQAGERVLIDGGEALDAVCAAVCVLEDDPLFNAGRGAALTRAGHVEHDAAVMTGAGRAGAVAVSRHARHPVLAARSVLARSEHVLLVDPPVQQLREWGLELVDNDWFVTAARQQQLARVQAGEQQPPRHGTVGAVALDSNGRLAAATSTGGICNQSVGRVGDSPLIGAGTYAREGVVAVSCTGHGEAFIEGVVAHDVAARIRYAGQSLAGAVGESLTAEVTGRGSSGGLIAVGGDGRLVVARNCPSMFAAWRDSEGVHTMVQEAD